MLPWSEWPDGFYELRAGIKQCLREGTLTVEIFLTTGEASLGREAREKVF